MSDVSEIIPKLMEIVEANTRLESRLDRIEQLADRAFEVGDRAVSMHRETRAVLDSHIEESTKFAESLETVKEMVERRKVVFRVGGWIKKFVTGVGVMIATLIGAITYLHSSAEHLKEIFKSPFGN